MLQSVAASEMVHAAHALAAGQPAMAVRSNMRPRGRRCADTCYNGEVCE